MLHGLAIVIFTFCMIGAILITPPDKYTEHEELQEDISGEERTNQADIRSSPEQSANRNAVLNVSGANNSLLSSSNPYPTLKSCILSRQFLLIYTMNLCGLMYAVFILVFYKTYGLPKVQDDQFTTLVGGVGSVLSAVAAGLGGVLSDKFDFKKVCFTIFVVELSAPLLLPFFGHLKPVFMFCSLVGFAMLGCSGGIFPSEISRIFGNKHGSTLSGLLNTGNVVAFCIIVALLKCTLHHIGYDRFIHILSVFVAIAILLSLKVRDN
eukprot:TRINITY_DN7763_c0_g1_i2.p1 TRINITY_DN7763_c0_g1~~TRINITY_DN7763_c0_g1_i2.p1  ORF type:complete len:266 (-),score=20.04 TRINITY_DN7763_c0_g1_i2:45-842(-)